MTEDARPGGGNGSLGSAMVALTAARLASVAAVFLAGVVAARLLDASAMGVAGVGLTVGWAVAIVANGGLNIAAVYHLGRHSDDRAVLVGRLIGLLLGALAVGGIVTALVARVLGATSLDRQRPLVFVGAAVLAMATIAYEVGGALLLGLERRRAYVLSDLFRSAATFGLAVLVLGLVSRTAEGYVLATGLGVVVPAVFGLVVVRRTVGSLRPRRDREFTRSALRMGLAGQVGNVLTFLNLRLDLLLVPALLRLDLAGIYFVATRVSEVVGQASTAASSMLFPHVAGQADRRATAVTERTSRLTLLATLASSAVLAAVAPWVLTLFFGEVYRAGTNALSLLLVATVPLALARVLAADLKGRGRPGLVSIGTGVGAAVNVVANVVLIPLWGLEGAAVASVLSYGVMAIALLVSYRRLTSGRVLALLPGPADVVDAYRLLRQRVLARAA